MVDIEAMLQRLNPNAEEYVPSTVQHRPTAIVRTIPSRYASSKRNSMKKPQKVPACAERWRRQPRTSQISTEESIKRTVYVSDIDQQVTEEQLATLFLSCGQVVDCRICGDPNSILRFAFVEFTNEEGAKKALTVAGTMLGYYPLRVLPSKTAILPVNPNYLPKSQGEKEMCARTIYCTNIDKKVAHSDVKLFFESLCGEVSRLRLLGDSQHSTRIAFVEFVMAESAMAALNCSGAILGSLPIRVSPSKTPLRPKGPLAWVSFSALNVGVAQAQIRQNSAASDSFVTTADLAAMAELIVNKPTLSTMPLSLPNRILMGPGPATPHPRVLAAASLPLVGHMHPEFLTVMDEVKSWLQYTFQTQNPFTIAVSGSGHAAMEAAVASVVEPGDVVLVGVNGIWGERMTILAARYGADVRKMEAAPGKVFSVADVEKALADNPGVKVVFVVHGESSTGTLQPLEGLGELCHKNGALLFVDAVCTLGGIPLHVDAWGVDVIYSGSQKCLSAPVAPSPLSLSERARAKLANRSTPVQSYYFDMNLVGEYWGVDRQPRKYHHTGLVTNVNAMREALAMLAEEGLENVWQRHRSQAELLWAGLQELGLELFVEDHGSRLPTVTTVKVPEGVEWTKVTGHLMSKFNLEIAGGLGPTVGKVWRIGLMGNNARPANVALLLEALKDALEHAGFTPKKA
ncbi:unnamed protein product [Closterium sp. NIES-64]|nr:unnamed protein product [Closterium sp. NIES-64]